MKVFIYYKDGSAKFAVFKNVDKVVLNRQTNRIEIYTDKCGVMEFDTAYFKTTIFQN